MGCQGGSPSHPKLGGYFMMLFMGVNSSRRRLHIETRARCELGSRGGRAELSREKRTGGVEMRALGAPFGATEWDL